MTKLKALALATTAALALAVAPAHAIVVFDPSNFAENVLQAARSLEQINNQIKSLQNEVRMLEDMAKHLEKLDFTSLPAIEGALKDINQLTSKAKGIAFDVKATASSSVSKARVTCALVSVLPVQPISGSITRGAAGSCSSSQSLVLA